MGSVCISGLLLPSAESQLLRLIDFSSEVHFLCLAWDKSDLVTLPVFPYPCAQPVPSAELHTCSTRPLQTVCFLEKHICSVCFIGQRPIPVGSAPVGYYGEAGGLQMRGYGILCSTSLLLLLSFCRNQFVEIINLLLTLMFLNLFRSLSSITSVWRCATHCSRSSTCTQP